MNEDQGLERGPRRFRLSNLTSSQQFWVPLAIVLVLALAGGGIASVTTGAEAPPPVASEEDDEGGVAAPVAEDQAPDPDTVFDDPGKYVGQELTLSVIVEKVIDVNTFRVVSEDPNDPSLLVVYSGSPPVKKQAIIKASGTITEFTAPAVNKALGAQLPVATFDASDDEYALVATSVEIVIGGGGGGSGTSTDTAATGTGTTAVALAPPAPAYDPGPSYVPPPSGTSSGTSTGSTGTSSGSEGTGSSSGTGSSGNGSTGSSEPSGGSGGEPSGGANGGPAAGRADLTFTEQSASSGQYSDATYLEALLTDKDGAPLVDKKLTFVVGGSEYTARTNDDGIASTSPTLSDEPGNYQLEVFWQRAGEKLARDKDGFEVLQDDSVLQVSVEGNGNNSTFTARLTDGDSGSTGLSGREIEFYTNDGEFLGSATTDESGVARLDVPENYHERKDDFGATFDGDGYYLTSSATSE